jgi:hypothetical protein
VTLGEMAMVELLAMTLGGRAVSAGNIPQNTKLGKKAKCDYDQATSRSRRRPA